jgi:single-strand DNA-binding protein
MDLNKAQVIGRLTRDPEMRTTPQGTTVTSFSVATNFVWTDQSGLKKESVEFHNIVAWRKLAEIIGQYLKKGSRVYIEGRLQTRTWDGQDGSKKNRTEIVADNMIMLDSKGSGSPARESSEEPPKAQADQQEDLSAPPVERAGEAPRKGAEAEEISVEEIPF